MKHLAIGQVLLGQAENSVLACCRDPGLPFQFDLGDRLFEHAMYRQSGSGEQA